MLKNLKNTWSLLSRKNKNYFIVVLLFSIVSSLLEVLSLGMVIPILGLILDPIYLQSLFFYENVMKLLGNPNTTLFTLYAVSFLIFVFFSKNLFLSIFTWFQLYYINTLRTELSKKLYKIYLNLPLVFHLENNSTILFRNIDYEILNVSQTVQKIITFIIEFLVLFSIVIFLFFYDFKITLISFLIILILGSSFFLIMKVKLNNWGNKRQFHSGEFLKHLFHGINSIKDVKMLNRQDSFLNLFHKNQVKAIKFSRFETLTAILTKYWLEFLSIFGLGIFISLTTLTNKPGSEIVITLGLFGAAIYRLAPSTNKIINSLNSIQFLSPSVSVIKNEFLKIEKKNLDSEKKVQTLDFFNSIEFKNLNYRYPGKHNFILADSEFNIEKNSITGFFGKSGSGKTTMINIICNLLKPETGHVLIDGKKFTFDDESWKLDIGYVSQSTALIDDTLEKNIAFGISEKDINYKNMEKSIKISKVDSFLNTLPHGLKTRIGEKGTRLSGGQQQRIGIARALYNNPKILILDEGTNSLDYKTEREILDEIKSLKKSLSIIIISHDMNIIKTYSDCFFEISNNKINKINLNAKN